VEGRGILGIKRCGCVLERCGRRGILGALGWVVSIRDLRVCYIWCGCVLERVWKEEGFKVPWGGWVVFVI
jgi:hypothetical protein